MSNRIKSQHYFAFFFFFIAIFNYSVCAQQTPDPTVYYNRAFEHQSAGGFREAIDEYQRVIQIKADFSPAHINLGVCYGLIGEQAHLIRRRRI
jgi:tetratricopeptide (TPR) repeat protein